MTRVKRGKISRARHKKLLVRVRGHRGGRSRLIRQAKQSALRAGSYAYTGRKLRKRDARRLWITRLSAALKPYELSYSRLIHALGNKKIGLDRKILAQIAFEEPEVFKKIINSLK